MAAAFVVFYQWRGEELSRYFDTMRQVYEEFSQMKVIASNIFSENLFGGTDASGAFTEVLSSPYIANPGVGSTGIVNSTPANSTATGVMGQFTFDTNYFYICTANNVWKRVTLNSF